MKRVSDERNLDVVDIFKKYNDRIYRYIFIRVNFNKQIAEDIAQEVFVKVLKNKQSFDPRKSSLKNWIFIIARNLVIDYYRKKKFENIPDGAQEYVSNNEDNIEDKAAFTEILDKLSELTDEEKELIIFYYIEDFSIDEISELVGKKYTATKISIYRALDKLKEKINGKDQ